MNDETQSDAGSDASAIKAKKTNEVLASDSDSFAGEAERETKALVDCVKEWTTEPKKDVAAPARGRGRRGRPRGRPRGSTRKSIVPKFNMRPSPCSSFTSEFGASSQSADDRLKTPVLRVPRLDSVLGVELHTVPMNHMHVNIKDFDEAYATYVRTHQKRNRLRPRRRPMQTWYREAEYSSGSEYIPSSGSEAEAAKNDSFFSDGTTSSDDDWRSGRNKARARNPRRKRAPRGHLSGVWKEDRGKYKTDAAEVDSDQQDACTKPISETTKDKLCSLLEKAPAVERVRSETEMREFVTRIMNGDCIYKDFIIWLSLNPLTMVRLECAPNMLPPTYEQFMKLQNKFGKVYCSLCAGLNTEESKLLEDYEDWLRHWREEHNMSRSIHCCKCTERFGCFPEFLHHMMSAKGGRTPHSALNCAFLYENTFLVASPNDETMFRCIRDDCEVEGPSPHVLAHVRVHHRNLGFTLNRCDLSPCDGEPLRSVSHLVEHLRKNHESLLMGDQSSTKRAELNILAHRSKTLEKTMGNHGTSGITVEVQQSVRPVVPIAPARGRPAIRPAGSGGPAGTTMTYTLHRNNNRAADDRPAPTLVTHANVDEMYTCGVCKAEHNAVSLMTCHQQYSHTYRMPVNCNKCGMPLPQLWTLIKQHYERGHGVVFQATRLLPFIYRRPVYFLRTGNNNRTMCSRCRASVLVGTELDHCCASDNKWHATGPPSRCGLCTESFHDHLTITPVRNHYLKMHGMCIVCLKEVPDRAVEACQCEEEHWQQEECEKQKLITMMVRHIDVLEKELEKKNTSESQNIAPPSRGRKAVDRVEVNRSTVKEAKRILYVLDVNNYPLDPSDPTDPPEAGGDAARSEDKQPDLPSTSQSSQPFVTKLTHLSANSQTRPETQPEAVEQTPASTEVMNINTSARRNSLRFLDYLYTCVMCFTQALDLDTFVAHCQAEHQNVLSCPVCPDVAGLDSETARQHVLNNHPDVGKFLPNQWPPQWHPFLRTEPSNSFVVFKGDQPDQKLAIMYKQEGPIFCLYCRQYAGSFHQLLIHLCMFHNTDAFRFRCPEPCLIIGNGLSSLLAVNKHVSECHHGLKLGCSGALAKYFCLSCDQLSSRTKKIEHSFPVALIHLRTVHRMRDFFFHCPVCPFLLLGGEKTLRYHLRQYHGDIFISAYEEGYLPVHFENMENLLAVVEEERKVSASVLHAYGRFHCGLCLKRPNRKNVIKVVAEVFASDGMLMKHYEEKHRYRPPSEKGDTVTALEMICPVCPGDKMICDRKAMRDHVEQHIREKKERKIKCQLRWVCQIEDCSYSVKNVLRDMILHAETVHGLTPESGEIILRCPFCRWLQSSDLLSMLRHLRMYHLLDKRISLLAAGITIQPEAVRGKFTEDDLPFRCVVENVRQPLNESDMEFINKDAEGTSEQNRDTSNGPDPSPTPRKKGRVKESVALRKSVEPEPEPEPEADQEPEVFEIASSDSEEEAPVEDTVVVPMKSYFSLPDKDSLSWDSEEGMAFLASLLMERARVNVPLVVPDNSDSHHSHDAGNTRKASTGSRQKRASIPRPTGQPGQREQRPQPPTRAVSRPPPQQQQPEPGLRPPRPQQIQQSQLQQQPGLQALQQLPPQGQIIQAQRVQHPPQGVQQFQIRQQMPPQQPTLHYHQIQPQQQQQQISQAPKQQLPQQKFISQQILHHEAALQAHRSHQQHDIQHRAHILNTQIIGNQIQANVHQGQLAYNQDGTAQQPIRMPSQAGQIVLNPGNVAQMQQQRIVQPPMTTAIPTTIVGNQQVVGQPRMAYDPNQMAAHPGTVWPQGMLQPGQTVTHLQPMVLQPNHPSQVIFVPTSSTSGSGDRAQFQR